MRISLSVFFLAVMIFFPLRFFYSYVSSYDPEES